MPEETIVTEIKRHAACDECRTRKLKCSGNQPKCSRCDRERIECIYSPQKPMGRPRKRRKDDEAPNGHHGTPSSQITSLRDMGADPLVYLAPGMGDTNFGQISFDVTPREIASAQATNTDGAAEPQLDSYMLPTLFPLDPALGAFTSDTQHDDGMHGWMSDSSHLSQRSPMSSEVVSNVPSPPCACLSSMYLTLSNLQALTNFSFPFALRPLRQAMITADQVLTCQTCLHDVTGGYLNVSIITSLLFALAERYRKVVEEIDVEAARAEESGSTKRFHLGDANESNMHLHTQTPDCPARFDIELDAAEWRNMSKKTVKKEVYGFDENRRGLVGMITRLEQRQMQWHADPQRMAAEDRMWGGGVMQEARKHGDYHCIKQAQHIRQFVDNTPW